MNWITKQLGWRLPVDAEAEEERSAERGDSLTDAFLETYVCWREACADVRGAYEGWRRCDAPDSDPAFEGYLAALDREEHAARVHAESTARLRAAVI